MSQTQKIKRIAYHEAGHAVVAYELHKRFSGISIIPDEDACGHFDLKVTRRIRFDYDDTSWKSRIELEKQAMVLYGGIVAEYLLTNRKYQTSSKSDINAVMACLSCLTGDSEELDAYAKWLWYRTKAILRRPWYWSAVQALAKELLRFHRIGERHARKIIRQAREEHEEYKGSTIRTKNY